jgi:RNA-directed DNA polymerase
MPTAKAGRLPPGLSSRERLQNQLMRESKWKPREACAPADEKMNWQKQERYAQQWEEIDWRQVQQNVRRLQARIVKATQAGRWGKVKALQRLLTRSFSGKALAVKRVTENQGKRTAGVDGIVWDTPARKWTATQNLRQRGYRPKPLRRVYIPKSSNRQKLRPLGIPTMKDRAMQALYLLALDPVSECTADPNSYGFRQKRSTADAIEQCFKVYRRREGAPEWVLEGDIRACFDQISHEWLLAHIPMEKAMLKKWLKCGYMEKHAFHSTQAGTPQGGIISPTLANLTLDGLEGELHRRFRPRDNSKPSTGVNLVRYADDFIISARSRDLLENQIRPFVTEFLQQRGLELSPEKTVITHIAAGFDFLGQNVRRYNGKLIIKPAKKNVQAFLNTVKCIIHECRAAQASWLIARLNPVIRGWANYHRHICATRTYHRMDHLIFWWLWRWARRRHPHKGAHWVRKKYFKTVGSYHWIFSGEYNNACGVTQTVHLRYLQSTHIRRHTKIQAAANPYDRQWDVYFEKRRT